MNTTNNNSNNPTGDAGANPRGDGKTKFRTRVKVPPLEIERPPSRGERVDPHDQRFDFEQIARHHSF